MRRVDVPRHQKRRLVFLRDGWKCVWCGSDKRLTLDHIVPRSQGGSSEIENFQTLCWDCNQSKADGHVPTTWMRRNQTRQQLAPRPGYGERF